MQREKAQERGLGWVFFLPPFEIYLCSSFITHYSSPSLLCRIGEHSHSEIKTHLARGSVLSAWSTCSTDPAPPQKAPGAAGEGVKPGVSDSPGRGGGRLGPPAAAKLGGQEPAPPR